MVCWHKLWTGPQMLIVASAPVRERQRRTDLSVCPSDKTASTGGLMSCTDNTAHRALLWLTTLTVWYQTPAAQRRCHFRERCYAVPDYVKPFQVFKISRHTQRRPNIVWQLTKYRYIPDWCNQWHFLIKNPDLASHKRPFKGISHN